MASNPAPTTRSRGDDTVTSTSHRERESKHERTSSSRKACVDESTSGGSGRDSRMSTSHKDYNKGELHSGAAEGIERKHDDSREERSKRRSEKSASSAAQESHERPSSTRTPSPSHLRRKPVPQEETPLRHEPAGPLISDHEDDSMGSPTSSFGNIESDIEEAKRAEPRDRELPLAPPPEPDPVVMQLESVVDKAEEDKKREGERRDRELAMKLDHDLNADPKRVPGGFPEASGDAAQPHHKSPRPSGGGGFFSSQPDKYRDKYLEYKRKYQEVEQIAIEWQKSAHYHQAMANKHSQELRMTQMELGSAQKYNQHLDNELKAAKHELGAVKQQLSDAVNLSEVRGKELKGAQVFLTKADTLSVSDVVQKVAALNEEIFQMAAFLGEVLVYEVLEEGSDRETVRQQVVSKAYDPARGLLGETLATALAQESLKLPKDPSNPLLVQIVMQIALTQWCANLASRWTSYHKSERKQRESDGGEQGEQKEPSGNVSVQKQSEYDSMLRELYDGIRDHEEQAVAGRWRSLTRAHLPFSANGWEHNLMVGITSIMGVAGWITRQSEEMGQIEKRLGSIFKPLLELRKATGEDVTSADLDIAIVEPGTTFDHRYMEDEYADGRSSSRSGNGVPEAVVSTIGLGLKKLTVKKMKEGGVQRQMEMLALPKVVLEKTIKEAMEPPPPAKKKKSKAAGGEGGGPGLISTMMGL